MSEETKHMLGMLVTNAFWGFACYLAVQYGADQALATIEATCEKGGFIEIGLQHFGCGRGTEYID